MYVETKNLVERAPVTGKTSRGRIRKIIDRLATGIVTTAGIGVIASILGLLILFLLVIAPLWRDPKVQITMQVPSRQLAVPPEARILAVGCEEYQQIGYLVTTDGSVIFYDLPSAKVLQRFNISLPAQVTLTSAWPSEDGQTFAAGTNKGELIFGNIDYQSLFTESQRSFTPIVSFTEPAIPDSARSAIKRLSVAGSPSESLVIAAITADGRLLLYSQVVETSLFGSGEAVIHRASIELLPSTPTAVVVEKSLANLYAGFDNGMLLKYDLQEPGLPRLVETMRASNARITMLGFLIGERSLVVGDAEGHVEVWFETFDETGAGPRKLRKAHTLAAHRATVNTFSSSQRNRTFFTGSEDGEIILHFSTNHRVLYRAQFSSSPITLISITPKADGALIVDATQELSHLSINNPHPEANWRAFFGKIWYEGYNKPEYVWQSSSGTDDFEAKLSLVPLIFGTLKGTFYALLFAFPIGVLSALYVSQFMHAQLRGLIKPTMEIMAALPSVVLGFIAGLWLAPRVQPIMPGVLAMLILVPSVALLFGWLWQNVPRRWIHRLKTGAELFFLIPFVVLAGWVCIKMSGNVEQWFFAGDFRQWLLDTFNLTYDQRNAFVVGLVMGFAVVPIIFTISEDALANVPSSLTAASLALGATQWQTALYVVLPTASPGIFSAAMVGFGRAVGETMIVLMATGNTPVMDWSIFNGFRTLSANIAVEIPEAPVGGTLFRSLFLAALMLFVMTFIVNTLAEVIRQRMRLKYQKQ